MVDQGRARFVVMCHGSDFGYDSAALANVKLLGGSSLENENPKAILGGVRRAAVPILSAVQAGMSWLWSSSNNSSNPLAKAMVGALSNLLTCPISSANEAGNSVDMRCSMLPMHLRQFSPKKNPLTGRHSRRNFSAMCGVLRNWVDSEESESAGEKELVPFPQFPTEEPYRLVGLAALTKAVFFSGLGEDLLPLAQEKGFYVATGNSMSAAVTVEQIKAYLSLHQRSLQPGRLGVSAAQQAIEEGLPPSVLECASKPRHWIFLNGGTSSIGRAVAFLLAEHYQDEIRIVVHSACEKRAAALLQEAEALGVCPRGVIMTTTNAAAAKFFTHIVLGSSIPLPSDVWAWDPEPHSNEAPQLTPLVFAFPAPVVKAKNVFPLDCCKLVYGAKLSFQFNFPYCKSGEMYACVIGMIVHFHNRWRFNEVGQLDLDHVRKVYKAAQKFGYELPSMADQLRAVRSRQAAVVSGSKKTSRRLVRVHSKAMPEREDQTYDISTISTASPSDSDSTGSGGLSGADS